MCRSKSVYAVCFLYTPTVRHTTFGFRFSQTTKNDKENKGTHITMRLLSSPTAALAAATALLALDTVSSFQAFHPSSNRLQSSHSNGLVPKHSGEFLVSSSSRVSTLPHLRRATPAGHHDETARNTRCLDSHKQQAPFKAWPLLGNWALVRMRAQRWFRHCHRTVTSTAVALLVVFACHSGSALAVSGGRMGGSFGATNRFSPPSYGSPSTTSRSMPSSGRYHHQHHAPRIHVHTGSSGGSSSLHGSFTTQDTFPGGTVAKASRFSASDIVLLTTTATVMAYGFTNNKRQQDGGGAVSPLGPGATVASMTISLHVQDRYDPDSLLNRLKDISKQCDTNQRQGVQNLVSEVALELLRQEENIVSATAHSKQFSKIGPAQREFQRLSVQGRSKFDRETGIYAYTF